MPAFQIQRHFSPLKFVGWLLASQDMTQPRPAAHGLCVPRADLARQQEGYAPGIRINLPTTAPRASKCTPVRSHAFPVILHGTATDRAFRHCSAPRRLWSELHDLIYPI